MTRHATLPSISTGHTRLPPNANMVFHIFQVGLGPCHAKSWLRVPCQALPEPCHAMFCRVMPSHSRFVSCRVLTFFFSGKLAPGISPVLGTGSIILVPGLCLVPDVLCHAVSICCVSVSSMPCRVITLLVHVSVLCRGNPDIQTDVGWISRYLLVLFGPTLLSNH